MDMIQHRKEYLEFLQNKINSVKVDTKVKNRLFQRIKPSTDHFLGKLNDSYMVDYVPNKVEVNEEMPYTYKDMESTFSGVEDYFKLIQLYSDSMKAKNKPIGDVDALRNEIQMTLEGLDSHKYINANMRTSMKNDYYKNGISFEDIIKKNSKIIYGNLTKSMATTDSNMKNSNVCLTATGTANKTSTLKKNKKQLAPLEVS